MKNKISGYEAFIIFAMFSINSILLNIPKVMIRNLGTGAFINSIFIGIIGLIFTIIIYKLINNFPSSDILDISNYLGGKYLKLFVGLLFIIIFFLIICIFIGQFVVLLKSVYFRNSPNLYILLFFIISILICNLNGFGAVKNSICFFFPISIITLSLVLKNSLSGFSLVKITPILGKSISGTFFSGISNLFCFTNILLLYFIQPYLDNNKNLKKITIGSFIFSWLLLIISVTTLLSAYPLDNNVAEINPLYTLTRRIELTEFVERADGLFVTIALLSCLSYISFLFYLITLILKKILIIENANQLSYLLLPFITGATYYMILTDLYKNSDAHKTIFNITVYVISLIILFFSSLKKKLTE